MSVPIIIFSVDSIRGRIILNTLRFNGFEALLKNRLIHASEIIRKNTPSIVILDTKELSTNELDFFRNAHPVLSNSTLILLASPSTVKSLDIGDIRTELCRTDPLDAELIMSKVEALLAQKLGSAEARKAKDKSAEALKYKSQELEVQKEDEPDYDSEGLEDDLKKFLDLE
jgi:DNA-binding response OmpR family regulator